MKTLPPCDHDECPPTQCTRTASDKAVVCKELFERCVVRKARGRRYEIKCRLGLWGAEGPSREAVEGEAWHYWRQYFEDGEYEKHLSNDAAIKYHGEFALVNRI